MAKKSTTKYRLVFESEFQPEWEAFVLECRKQGTTPDKLIQTLVAEYNGTGELPSPPTEPDPTMASPLASASQAGSEPEPSPPKTAKKGPAKGPSKKKKRTAPARKATKAAKGTKTNKTSKATKASKPARSAKPAKPKGSPPSRRKGPRKRRTTKGPGAPEGPAKVPELPSLETEDLSTTSVTRPQPGSLPPLKPETSGPPATAPRRTAPRTAAAVQIPAHASPKYQLLELMRQLDVERDGIEREDVLTEARSNSIQSPELNLNKLIRRGLVHIYEGRCRTT